MADTRTSSLRGVDWLWERRWDSLHSPLPERWVLPEAHATRRRLLARGYDQPQPAFRYCQALKLLCQDVVTRCRELNHIDPNRLLISFTPSRNASPYGLQARVTPMRFRQGALTRRVRGTEYRVQRYFVDEREMLYIVTFCMPRFIDQTFQEKLITVFHELYHICPSFNGDLRRHPGRYAVHTHSKRDYDRHMAHLVREYLRGHDHPEVFAFLKRKYLDLWQHHGGLKSVIVPRPKLLPVLNSTTWPGDLISSNQKESA